MNISPSPVELQVWVVVHKWLQHNKEEVTEVSVHVSEASVVERLKKELQSNFLVPPRSAELDEAIQSGSFMDIADAFTKLTDGDHTFEFHLCPLIIE